MRTTSDRRAAVTMLCVAVLVFSIVIAAAPRPTRDSETVLRQLVQLLTRNSHRSSRVDYALRRVADDGRVTTSQVAVWLRDRPYLNASLSGSALEVETSTLAVHCEISAGEPLCVPEVSGPGRSDGALPFFVAVHSTHRYDALDLGAVTIAHERANCFRIALRPGQVALTGLGSRVDLCFANDGVLLRSDQVKPGAHDTRVATLVQRGVDQAELAGVLRRFGDDKVRGL